MTSQDQDALRLRQVETHFVLTECSFDMIVLNQDDSAPPLPPAPRSGDPGYEFIPTCWNCEVEEGMHHKHKTEEGYDGANTALLLTRPWYCT